MRSVWGMSTVESCRLKVYKGSNPLLPTNPRKGRLSVQQTNSRGANAQRNADRSEILRSEKTKNLEHRDGEWQTLGDLALPAHEGLQVQILFTVSGFA